MKILINTDRYDGSYDVDFGTGGVSNDELCRAIALLRLVESQLNERLTLNLEAEL